MLAYKSHVILGIQLLEVFHQSLTTSDQSHNNVKAALVQCIAFKITGL